MSRVLWFILGGIVTAIGTGIAAALLDSEESTEDPAPQSEVITDAAEQDDQ